MVLNDIVEMLITSTITIIGFAVTIGVVVFEKKEDTKKSKIDRQLEDLYGTQLKILDFVDELARSFAYQKKSSEYDRLKKEIYGVVICSGSEDAIKILLYIQELEGSCNDDGMSLSLAGLIAPYILLAMQIKYDTTGVKTSPEIWYSGKYNTKKMLEIGNFYTEAVNVSNRIVETLKLRDFLVMKYKQL